LLLLERILDIQSLFTPCKFETENTLLYVSILDNRVDTVFRKKNAYLTGPFSRIFMVDKTIGSNRKRKSGIKKPSFSGGFDAVQNL